jgi:hypothetical protein
MLQNITSDLGLAEDKDQWQVYVDMVMKFWVP